MYAPVPLPSGAGGVREWILSEPLRDLVALFGGDLPVGETRAVLSWLDDFSRTTWDFREGAERSAISSVAIDDDLGARIRPAVAALGLTGHNQPSRRSYESLLVLGGGVLGCLLRTSFAAALVAQGLRVSDVHGLGSLRPLSESEIALAGPGRRTEADALRVGFERAGLRGSDVVVAYPAEPGGRANTADTYAAWLAEAKPPQGTTVLIVTSEIYVPFQHCDAIRALEGCVVETIGAPAGHALPDGTRQHFGPANYLQEVRSAIRSMGRL